MSGRRAGGRRHGHLGTAPGADRRIDRQVSGTAHHGTAPGNGASGTHCAGARETTIADVAHRWGLPSQAHFARLFRARFGLTPSEARAEAAT
nr:AraC family transcriptional regulator [Streptomyces cavernae]